MKSSRPYVVRALYEWIIDNACTPYVLVDAEHPGAQVPRQHVRDGQIVLNISATAVMALQIGNDEMTCNARFGGVPMQVIVPMGALLGIYARENGQGMMFEAERPTEPPTDPAGGTDVGASSGSAGKGTSRPSLKVVK